MFVVTNGDVNYESRSNLNLSANSVFAFVNLAEGVAGGGYSHSKTNIKGNTNSETDFQTIELAGITISDKSDTQSDYQIIGDGDSSYFSAAVSFAGGILTTQTINRNSNSSHTSRGESRDKRERVGFKRDDEFESNGKTTTNSESETENSITEFGIGRSRNRTTTTKSSTHGEQNTKVERDNKLGVRTRKTEIDGKSDSTGKVETTETANFTIGNSRAWVSLTLGFETKVKSDYELKFEQDKNGELSGKSENKTKTTVTNSAELTQGRRSNFTGNVQGHYQRETTIGLEQESSQTTETSSELKNRVLTIQLPTVVAESSTETTTREVSVTQNRTQNIDGATYVNNYSQKNKSTFKIIDSVQDDEDPKHTEIATNRNDYSGFYSVDTVFGTTRTSSFRIANESETLTIQGEKYTLVKNDTYLNKSRTSYSSKAESVNFVDGELFDYYSTNDYTTTRIYAGFHNYRSSHDLKNGRIVNGKFSGSKLDGRVISTQRSGSGSITDGSYQTSSSFSSNSSSSSNESGTYKTGRFGFRETTGSFNTKSGGSSKSTLSGSYQTSSSSESGSSSTTSNGTITTRSSGSRSSHGQYGPNGGTITVTNDAPTISVNGSATRRNTYTTNEGFLGLGNGGTFTSTTINDGVVTTISYCWGDCPIVFEVADDITGDGGDQTKQESDLQGGHTRNPLPPVTNTNRRNVNKQNTQRVPIDSQNESVAWATTKAIGWEIVRSPYSLLETIVGAKRVVDDIGAATIGAHIQQSVENADQIVENAPNPGPLAWVGALGSELLGTNDLVRMASGYDPAFDPHAEHGPTQYTFWQRVGFGVTGTLGFAGAVSGGLGIFKAASAAAGPIFGAGKTKATKEVLEEGGLNLFKWKDATSTRSSGWREGDRFLYLPNQGSVRANWAQNARRLREAIRRGKPIFDSYVDDAGNLIPSKGFLNAERNLLKSRGWEFNPSTGAWHPPGELNMDTSRTFREIVLELFAPIVSKYEYNLVESNESYVQFASNKTSIQLNYDERRSFEVDLGFSEYVNGECVRKIPFNLGEVFRECNVPAADTNSHFQSSDILKVYEFLTAVAEKLSEYCSCVLSGDPICFDALSKRRSTESVAYTRTVQLDSVRGKAMRAWENKKYQEFFSLFIDFKDVLSEPERRKLEYAEKQVGNN